MKRLIIFFLVLSMAGCSSYSGRLLGSLSEPVDIEVAIPNLNTEAVPLLFGFISDSYKDSIYPINLSLRKFVESDVPYFPLQIPVGRYPTRLSVDRSQKRLFVLNYLDKNISLIDTVNLVEGGFPQIINGKIVKRDEENKALRKNIDIYGSDLKVVYNKNLNKEFLLVVGTGNDSKGRLQIIDIDEQTLENRTNEDVGKTLFDLVLDILPSDIVSALDGDNVFIGSKDKGKFAMMNLSSQGLIYFDAPFVPDTIRLNGDNLYLVDTVLSRFAIFNIAKMGYLPVLPDSIFGKIYNQPFQTDRVRDIVFSKNTNIGVITNAPQNMCTGTVAYLLNTSGNVFITDTDGCTLCEEADSQVNKVPCSQKGWYNLPVENELLNPTVSRPVLMVEDKILSYNEQGLAEYPYIDKWDNSDRNFGIGISRLFRANMFNRQIQITYEGAIVEGTGSIVNGRFLPDIIGFENLNITEGDVLQLLDVNGNPLANCDDGTLVESSEFDISSLSVEGISVIGNLPKDDCLSKYYFFTRPKGGWSITIDGYGFIGRAYENTPFVLKDSQGYSHIYLTLKSGQEPSKRGMKFVSTIFLNPYGFSPGEKLITPARMKIVDDSVDPNRDWGLVVYTGSQALWQFSARDLNSSSSILYK